ncbi:MAG: hypothetical protein ACLQF0_05335 [Dissulfurispiraceae bacterium]
MKKIFVVIFVVFALLLASALPGQAWDRGHWGGGWRGGVWIGPGWGWDPWLWGPPYYPYYGGYNPYYAAPPVVVQQQPQQYVQPAPQQEEQSYWYFCGNPQGYYPYVKKCPGGWMKVAPPSTPPDYESHGEPAQAPPYQGR